MGYITTIPYISSSILFILLNPNGDPQLSRQKKNPHGKRNNLTAKVKDSSLCDPTKPVG